MRVLVVEDDSLICTLTEDFLDDLGCDVVGTAALLDDGLTKAKSLAIDAAVLDINLEGQLSYPIALALRARAIPFLFATGYGRAGVPRDFEGVPVLSKPFGREQLKEALLCAIAITDL